MKLRSLECCVCGSGAGRWQQHWNRDTGYGVCVSCVQWMRGRGTTEDEIRDLYGKEGVNWGNAPPDDSEAEARAICGK